MGQLSDHSLKSFLTSKKLALSLFIGLGLFLIPQTLLEKEIIFHKEIKFILLLALWINLAACTFYRFNRSTRPALLFHIGCLLTIAGALAGNLGYVATINIYEGDKTTTAYRWDKESDYPLGFGLRISKVNRDNYPTPIKVGVLENGEKKELFQIKTGDSFTYGKYRIIAGRLDAKDKFLMLDIYEKERFLFNYNTNNPLKNDNFDLDFVLVAFQNPVLKRVWVDMEIETEEKVIKGISEVNNPFKWNNISFFHTANGVDPLGKVYAGIQIVKDPGIPIVYLGFLVIFVGCLLRLITARKETPRRIR